MRNKYYHVGEIFSVRILQISENIWSPNIFLTNFLNLPELYDYVNKDLADIINNAGRSESLGPSKIYNIKLKVYFKIFLLHSILVVGNFIYNFLD